MSCQATARRSFPRAVGLVRTQAVRASTITKLYRDLMAGGGKNGRPLSSRTVDYVHAILRKAFRDAVNVDELLSSSPVDKAKRPRREIREPGTVWTTDQLKAFLRYSRDHRLWPFFHLAAYTGARRGELLIKRYNETYPDHPLPHARLHDLRHIHATTLLLAGVPVHVVAARLGHADPSITLRVYAQVIRAAGASAAEVFAKSINDQKGWC
ncbi:tyrosine-type recombinase/integrase [Nonomuraea deserti]|nr:tyrosine-type recombinase/integrase [Nonomuraea deserti]